MVAISSSLIFTLVSVHMVSAAVAGTKFSPRGSSAFDNTSRRSALFERDVKCTADEEKVSVVDRLTNLASTGSVVFLFGVTSGTLASSVCEIAANRGQADQANCKHIGTAISSTVYLAFGTAIVAKSGSISTVFRRSEDSLSTSLAAHLKESGTGYDMIASMPMSNSHFQQTGAFLNATKQPLERVSITGMRHDDTSIDAIVTTYDDGTGHIFASPTPQNATGLTKRQDGPGFKVNYSVFKNSVFGQFPSDKQLSARLQLSQDLAQDWVDRADNKGMSEWIGIAKIDGIIEFGLRIIPESNGFGEEFESVNVCGPLKKDEL